VTTSPSGISAVYVISVASRMCNLHPQTLRTYERLGFLAPARSRGGVRLYSDEDLRVLMRIAELAAEGLNLEGVRRVLLLEAEVERLRREVQSLRGSGVSSDTNEAV
jgi:MerR family transcriptional regulator/heat shock protein HspR